MPDLSEIGDPTALRNRYSGRTIFMVEGPGDKNAFESIVGPGFEADLEFQVAPHLSGTGLGGCRAVRDRIRADRSSNPKLYGLLDGEAAAALGAVDDLLTAKDRLFTPADPALDLEGCLFISVHELENLYFGEVDFCGKLADHAPAARLHLQSRQTIAETFETCLGLFVTAAQYKYASADLHFRNLVRGIINTKIFGSGDRAALRPHLEPIITSTGQTTWTGFRARVVEIMLRMRSIAREAGWDRQEHKAWRVRMADGKQLLTKLRETHGGIGDAVEGHLLKALAESNYPTAFRRELFALTGLEPSTSPQQAL